MQKSDVRNLPPGTMVGGFQIESLIGEGAMAVVYKAVQVSLDRPVALKILLRDFTEDQDYINRFFNEARSAALFSHPNIVHALDAGVADDNIYYFAMEYVEGETLEKRIKREGKLSVNEALRIALKIAAVLDYGWREQRLSHGDIKPANILLTQKDEVKLADFGLAKVRRYNFKGDGIMLTPLYAAPEVIRGESKRETCAADIYAFGITLYEMLTGTPPFTGDTSQEIMDKQIEQPVPFVQSVNENVPEKLSTYLVRLLAKSPDKRPESWSQVIKELEKNRKSQRKSHVASAPGARSFSQPNSVRKFSSHRNYQAQRQTSADIKEKKKRTKTQKQITLLLLLLIVLATGLYLLDSLPMAEKDDEKEDDTRRAENVEEDTSEDKPAQEDSDLSGGQQEDEEQQEEAEEDTDDKRSETDPSTPAVRSYRVIESEDTSIKALTKPPSHYSSRELESLPMNVRKRYRIVVPSDISRRELKLVMKDLLKRRTKKNPEIDGISIFAYDREEDAQGIFTMARMEWCPNGKWDAMTPDIARSNDRSSYKCVFTFKDKVSNISNGDVPKDKKAGEEEGDESPFSAGQTREDEDPDDEVDEAREGADTSLDWRARSRYRNLIRDISRSELSVLQAPPAISQQIDDWLNYVGDSGAETDEVKAVIFLQDTVVPALDKVHETLVQQGEILTDRDLEIEGLEGKTLKEIKEKGLMVSEEVETGENQRGRVAQLMKWQEIDEPEYIFPIVEQLLTGSDADDLGVDEARALLGYSLLSIKKPESFDNRKNVYEVIIDYLDKPDVTIPDAEKEKWRDLADVFR